MLDGIAPKSGLAKKTLSRCRLAIMRATLNPPINESPSGRKSLKRCITTEGR
jgi:hypothetical protein